MRLNSYVERGILAMSRLSLNWSLVMFQWRSLSKSFMNSDTLILLSLTILLILPKRSFKSSGI